MPVRRFRNKDSGKLEPLTATSTIIGHQFANLRKRAGISQTEMAAAIGVHRNTVYRIEHGEPITFELFLAYCKALAARPGDVIDIILLSIEYLAHQEKAGALAPAGDVVDSADQCNSE